MKVSGPRSRLFTGCRPEVAAGPDGRILAAGAGARAAAGRTAEVIELSGRAWPGLIDAHLHVGGLAANRLTLDLTGAGSLEAALALVREHASDLPAAAWVVGRGWHNDAWPDPAWPDRRSLDAAGGGRPVFLVRRDGHSAWLSTAALERCGLGAGGTEGDPPGGMVDREPGGAPAGILRETAVDHAARALPRPPATELDRALAAVLRSLARRGLTSVHSMDTPEVFASLQRLRGRGPLPVRVTWNLPAAELGHAERLGIRSGWGDRWLRIWGVKAFLDGSMGSRTAEMLDGSGVAVLPQLELEDLVRRCAAAELNVCLHAIGDGAVRRALDALEPLQPAWRWWRPRIEHAQCVHPDDMSRFARAGAIASMQPIHAITDRPLVDREWPALAPRTHAWKALARAGAVLAFGSDAPVEDASPLRGLAAATSWRRRQGWHPELALRASEALRAYTTGAAYAAGLESEVGRLRAGMLCDLTVVDRGRVEAAVAGGRLTWRRRRKASPRSSPGAR